MTAGFTSVAFAPLIPWPLIAALALVALVPAGLGIVRRARGAWLRLIALTALALALANPELVREEREPLSDVAILLIDDSPSQQIAPRPEQGAAALKHVRERLARFPDLEVRELRLSAQPETGEDGAPEGTRLFGELARALAEVPRGRLAGVLAITDGQAHDAPASPAGFEIGAPVHVLLTGRRDETDRRLTITQASTYGIVGKSVEVTLRVEDTETGEPAATLRMKVGAGGSEELSVPVGRDHTIKIPIEHRGPIPVELEVASRPGELSLDNNRAVLTVNGVRDRLRVLLVSGQPHPGERTWRRLLKSDPSVDLVHFTILRPPEKDDFTPLEELALITFPTRELFQEKLNDFDLIIFDRYRLRGVLPTLYLEYTADYVRRGGAVLLSEGPEFAGNFSLFKTPLKSVLPAEPTGRVLDEGFRPRVSPTGRRHPVTANLPRGEGERPEWGRWFRQVDAQVLRGSVLMLGPEERPLLVLDRVDRGRVAILLSDQIWLWSRRFEGGGPQAELLRRLAHWLMKEPDLEEDTLSAEVQRGQMTITRRSLDDTDAPVTVTAPSGKSVSAALGHAEDGVGTATLAVSETGIYRLSDGSRTAFAAAGAAYPVELADARATEEKLAPVVAASGGKLAWIADGRLPDLRRYKPGRESAGVNWMGFRANGDYRVTGLSLVPLLPGLLVLALGLGALAFAWRREGR
ncbi:MAG: hypothetical protein HY521_05245 [Proteobacteria bacterium]|nr:hypothetical protein [Pseudomonadota bacterium]